MVSLRVLLVLAWASVAAAQQSPALPTLKGQTLGEPVSVYLEEHVGEPYVSSCQQVFRGSTTAKEQRKLEHKFKVDVNRCRDIIAALRGDRWTPLSGPLAQAPDEAWPTYEHGKAVRIEMITTGTPYKSVLEDLIKDLGKPNRTDIVSEQEDLVLYRDSRIAVWSASNYYVSALEMGHDTMEPKTLVRVMTPQEHEMEEANKHKPKADSATVADTLTFGSGPRFSFHQDALGDSWADFSKHHKGIACTGAPEELNRVGLPDSKLDMNFSGKNGPGVIFCTVVDAQQTLAGFRTDQPVFTFFEGKLVSINVTARLAHDDFAEIIYAYTTKYGRPVESDEYSAVWLDRVHAEFGLGLQYEEGVVRIHFGDHKADEQRRAKRVKTDDQ